MHNKLQFHHITRQQLWLAVKLPNRLCSGKPNKVPHPLGFMVNRILNTHSSIHPLRCLLRTKLWQSFMLQSGQYLGNTVVVPNDVVEQTWVGSEHWHLL